MLNSEHRYQERELQLMFVRYLANTVGYIELFDDIDANGNDIDSAGLIGAQPVIIEFKDILSPTTVRFSDKKCGSIERKLSSALLDLRGNKPRGVLSKLFENHVQTTPVFLIVANTLSREARKSLINCLEEKAVSWGFDWRIYTAKPDITEIANGLAGHISHRVNIPFLREQAPRRRLRPKKDEFMRIFYELKVGDIYSALVDAITRSGGIALRPNMANINFALPYKGSKSNHAMIGAFTEHSNQENGLFVGYAMEYFRVRYNISHIDESALPGIEAPRDGFLNSNRYLRNQEEAVSFWSALTSSIN